MIIRFLLAIGSCLLTDAMSEEENKHEDDTPVKEKKAKKYRKEKRLYYVIH